MRIIDDYMIDEVSKTRLTSNQAGELARALINAKQRYAPKSRGTIAIGNQKDVGNMIQGKKTKRISKKD